MDEKSDSCKILSCDLVTIDGFRLMTGFIALFDTARDYTLQYTVLHTHTHTHTPVSTVTSSQAVAW
jgi:hypothetical protein